MIISEISSLIVGDTSILVAITDFSNMKKYIKTFYPNKSFAKITDFDKLYAWSSEEPMFEEKTGCFLNRSFKRLYLRTNYDEANLKIVGLQILDNILDVIVELT